LRASLSTRSAILWLAVLGLTPGAQAVGALLDESKARAHQLIAAIAGGMSLILEACGCMRWDVNFESCL
jgi:hypothetical protein